MPSEKKQEDNTLDVPIKSSFSQLRQLEAEDIMTPRADIHAIPSNLSFEQLVQQFQKSGHSRLPVYKDEMDSIYGMVHIKDLIPHMLDHETFMMGKFIRKVLFASPSIRLDELLLDMQQSQTHLALIIDEYGGIDGLITIEDILEELVGEIRDEHEENQEPLIVKNTSSLFIANGKVHLDEVEKAINLCLPSLEDDDVETLGGYIAALEGGMPKINDVILEPETGIKFEIIQASPRTIDRIMIHLPVLEKNQDIINPNQKTS